MSKAKSSSKAKVSNLNNSGLSKLKGSSKATKIGVFFAVVLLLAVGVTLGYNKYSTSGSGAKGLSLKAKALGPSDFTDTGLSQTQAGSVYGVSAVACVVQLSTGNRGVVVTYSKNGSAPALKTTTEVDSGSGQVVTSSNTNVCWNNEVTATKLISYSPGDQIQVGVGMPDDTAGFMVGSTGISLDSLKNCDSSLNAYF